MPGDEELCEIDTSQELPSPAVHNQTNKLAEVAGLFLRLGFTAFGGPAAHIAMMRDEVVRRRHWVTDERFIDLMGVANLIPGPTSTELAIYLGYVRAGWPGLLLGGICFIGPAMLIVLTLAWAYVAYGALPQVSWLFYGIQPVVVAIIAQAIWNLGRTILKGIWPLVLTVSVLILYLVGVNVLVLLFGGGLLYGGLRWIKHWQTAHPMRLILLLPLPLENIRFTWRSIASVMAGAAVPFTQLGLFLTFLKFGAVIYGSGYVLLAFLRADLVQNLHWLTDQQLLDAISVGQFTPGPVFTTATFIGYVLGSWPGAILATVGIFLPSFVLIALVHPAATRLRQSPVTAPILDGVNIAAVALMTGVLLQLGQHALTDVLTVALALLSLMLLVRFKVNSVWLILAGAIVGLIRFGLFK
jgi:chromate transporter